MDRFSTTEARQKLSDIVSRVEFGKESIALTRRERPVAVVVPYELYERLRQYEEDLEDAYFSKLADEARAAIDAGEETIPHDAVVGRVKARQP